MDGMLTERQVINEVLNFVGPSADKVHWRLGVTNDCQRIFDSYAGPQAAKQCFEAADHQTARRAVDALLKQGFNGINTGLPLKDFRYIFLYQLSASRDGTAESPPPAAFKLPDIPIIKEILGPDAKQAEISRELKAKGQKSAKIFVAIIGIWILFSVVSSILNAQSSSYEPRIEISEPSVVTDPPETPSGAEQQLVPLSPALHDVGLSNCSEPLTHGTEEVLVQYASQLCWHNDEQGSSQALFIEQSDSLDELLRSSLLYSCSPETPDSPEGPVYYIRGPDFWISGSLFFSSTRTKSNQQIRAIYDGLLLGEDSELELVDWCQSEPSGDEPVT